MNNLFDMTNFIWTSHDAVHSFAHVEAVWMTPALALPTQHMGVPNNWHWFRAPPVCQEVTGKGELGDQNFGMNMKTGLRSKQTPMYSVNANILAGQ
jgi:hypothetical protein